MIVGGEKTQNTQRGGISKERRVTASRFIERKNKQKREKRMGTLRKELEGVNHAQVVSSANWWQDINAYRKKKC